MTKQHMEDIGRRMDHFIAATGANDDGQAVLAAIAIVERVLIDINRLADAAEALAARPAPPPPVGQENLDEIKSAVLSLKDRVADVERKAVLEFLGWLSTRPGTTKIGSSYPVPPLVALVDEFMALPSRVA